MGEGIPEVGHAQLFIFGGSEQKGRGHYLHIKPFPLSYTLAIITLRRGELGWVFFLSRLISEEEHHQSKKFCIDVIMA